IIWAATRAGVYRFVNERWEALGRLHGLPDGAAGTIYVDSRGNVWAGTSSGVFRLEPEQEQFHRIDDSLGPVTSLSESRDGSLWATDPHIGFRMVGRKGRLESAPSSARHGAGQTLLHDRSGNLWVGTLGDGLWLIPNDGTGNSSVKSLGTHDGLFN